MNELVKVKKVNEVLVTSSKNLAKVLGKEHSKVIRSLEKIRSLESKSSFKMDIMKTKYTDKKGEIRPMYLLSEKGIKMLLSTYRGITQEQVKACGVEDLNIIHTYTRFEISFINMLDEALGEINVKGIPQYSIDNGKYRIDYYIPKLKLAIEYDEEQHNTTNNMELDKEREDYIINKLDCKFIRCDYKNSDIKNVMKVLKEIM